jgi:hypothetical protein
MTPVRRGRWSFLFVIAAALLVTAAADAKAQAWALPRGDGDISFTYQRINNTGHRRTNGFLVPRGRSLDMSLYLEAEYAFTNRFSVAAGLPYVFAKYTDPNPPLPPIPFLPQDQCRCWQSGWQDFGATARYNLVGGASGDFGLTAYVSLGAPSHDYNFRGEAALGRNLREERIGIDAGRRLVVISRNLSVQGGYSYAFVEKVMGISTNRSNASIEGDFFIKRKLLVRGEALWQRTHGGLRFGSPPPADLVFPGEVNTPELLYQHDRLLRDNSWHAGGGLAYSFPQVDVFATYIAFVGGTDTHAGGALTISLVVPFRLGGPQRPSWQSPGQELFPGR